jgi:hypothetical protein
VSLLVTVAGCSTSTDDVTIADLPDKSIATWSMPTDPYVEDDNMNDGYALDLLVSACLAESGESYRVAWQPAGKDSDPTTNPAGRRIFTEPVAREYGYHRARIFDLPGFEGAKERFEAGTAGVDFEEVAECRKSQEKRFPLLASDITPLGRQLGDQAYQAAAKDRRVLDAAMRWRDCMKPQGIADLPAGPEDMPTDSMDKKMGIYDNSDSAERSYPSEEEVEAAVADATCRDTTGYDKTLYDAEWNRQLDLVKENADELTRVRGQLEEHYAFINETISKHAPAKP